MNEIGRPPNGFEAPAAEPSGKPTGAAKEEPRQTGKAVSDPREVATLVMARMHMVNSKKDELTIAIKGLSDMAQQLATAYGQQLLLIEQLRKRVQTLEAAAGSGPGAVGTNGVSPQPGQVPTS